jgi:hypothetical protein
MWSRQPLSIHTCNCHAACLCLIATHHAHERKDDERARINKTYFKDATARKVVPGDLSLVTSVQLSELVSEIHGVEVGTHSFIIYLVALQERYCQVRRDRGEADGLQLWQLTNGHMSTANNLGIKDLFECPAYKPLVVALQVRANLVICCSLIHRCCIKGVAGRINAIYCNRCLPSSDTSII